ncbi:MAG: PepSY domain-containing protein [Hyphomicrobiaceae bacterium]
MTVLKLAATALLIGLAIPALASDDDRRGHRERVGHHDGESDGRIGDDSARAGWLNRDQVASKLAESGLKADRVKADDGRYEVYATDAAGNRVKVYLDPTTGAVIPRSRGGRD